MLHDPVANLLSECYERLADYQFVLVDSDSGEPLALGNSIPLAYAGSVAELPEEGWDWALRKGIELLQAGGQGNIQCALQVVVFTGNRGKGISGAVVQAMKDIGCAHGLKGMIAPVRPSLKHRYPLNPISSYIGWINELGLPFDPWLRVHVKLGAQVIKPCHKAMRVTGSIADWEAWTGLRFPETGRYIVPGALAPVEVEREQNLGLYVEPNVWVFHPPER
jgi:hypothetical protein